MLPAPVLSRQLPASILPRQLPAPLLSRQDCFEGRKAAAAAETSDEAMAQSNSQLELVAVDRTQDTLFEHNGLSWPLSLDELFAFSPQPLSADNES